MVQGFGCGETFGGVELEETFEEVDGLRRGFGKDLLEGDLRITGILLLPLTFSLLNVANFNTPSSGVLVERLTPSVAILRSVRSSGVPMIRII